MGGFGSGRNGGVTVTVENGKSLDANRWMRERILAPGRRILIELAVSIGVNADFGFAALRLVLNGQEYISPIYRELAGTVPSAL